MTPSHGHTKVNIKFLRYIDVENIPIELQKDQSIL